MSIFAAFFLAVLAFICWEISGSYFERKNYSQGLLCAFLGIFVMALLFVSLLKNPSGLPLNDIRPGTYKVGSVYVAGDNVNVALELKMGEKGELEKIYFYQFKKNAFEGALDSSAKKLVVIQTGNFKKLRLE